MATGWLSNASVCLLLQNGIYLKLICSFCFGSPSLPPSVNALNKLLSGCSAKTAVHCYRSAASRWGGLLTTAAIARVILGMDRDCSGTSRPLLLGAFGNGLEAGPQTSAPLRKSPPLPCSEELLLLRPSYFPSGSDFPCMNSTRDPRVYSRNSPLGLAVSSAMTVASDLETAHSAEGVPSIFYCFLSSLIWLFKMVQRQELSHYFID